MHSYTLKNHTTPLLKHVLLKANYCVIIMVCNKSTLIT